MSSPSSAASRAEPTWRTMRRRPSTDSAIWTAVAPEAVRTRRIQTICRAYRPELVPSRCTKPDYHPRSKRWDHPREMSKVTQLRFDVREAVKTSQLSR